MADKKEYKTQTGEIVKDNCNKLQDASNLRFLMFNGQKELFGEFGGKTKLIESSVYKIMEGKDGI